MNYSRENIEYAVNMINSKNHWDTTLTYEMVVNVIQGMSDNDTLFPVPFYGIVLYPYNDMKFVWAFVTTHLDCSDDTLCIALPKDRSTYH